MLFAKTDISYNVHLGRFKTPSLIIDDKMLRLPLFEAVDETMKYLISQIKVAFEISGRTTQRTEIFEYPLPALRELVLNSLIHRDYLSPVDIQIKIFDKSITFFNPGTLFGNLTIADLKTNNYQAYARNKLLAEAFYLTGDIEKYGSGFKRIRDELRQYPTMNFDYNEIPNGFFVELSYTKQKTTANIETFDKDTENVVENVVENEIEIIKLLKINNQLSASDLAKRMTLTERSIQRYLKILKDRKAIKRIGPDKGGHWEVVK